MYRVKVCPQTSWPKRPAAADCYHFPTVGRRHGMALTTCDRLYLSDPVTRMHTHTHTHTHSHTHTHTHTNTGCICTRPWPVITPLWVLVHESDCSLATEEYNLAHGFMVRIVCRRHTQHTEYT